MLDIDSELLKGNLIFQRWRLSRVLGEHGTIEDHCSKSHNATVFHHPDHQPSGSWVECGNQVFCTPFPWGCYKALQHFCFKSKSEHSLHLFAFLTARGSLSQYRNPNRLFREIAWKRLRVCDLRVSIHTFKSRISFAEWRVCLCKHQKAASSCRGSFHESCS